jgi:hypothetical protein
MMKLALAIALGATLVSSASSSSMAQSFSRNGGNHYYEPGDNGSVWSYYPGYNDEATGAYARTGHAARSTQTAPQANGGGTHYYEGDDNGSVWSYYPGYRPLR